jgi:hypothetical protein
MKKKYSLVDSDVDSRNLMEKGQRILKSASTSTVALALALTSSTAILSGCTDEKDCDKDATTYADPTDSANYDAMDTADVAGYDFSTFQDKKTCD